MIPKSNESSVIRSTDSLDLRPQAKELADSLAKQIDLPVVYLVNSEHALNYAGRHARHHNQYWVTVRPQTDQNEYERILLSNLYRGVEERKRILRAHPHHGYLQALLGTANGKERIKAYFQLINRINAVVSTVDAELFLKPKGYEVSERQKQVQLSDRLRRLREYLAIQAKQPTFRWYPEIELGNLLDYARIASWGKAYADQLTRKLGKIKPSVVGAQYLSRLNRLITLFQSVGKQTDSDPAEWLLPQIGEILGLSDKVAFSRELAFVGSFRLENGTVAPQCSLVPEGIEDEELMLDGMRSVNEALVLLQEYLPFCREQEAPDVITNLILDGTVNAYANGTRKDGYFISFTAGLFRFLHDSMTSRELEDLPACSAETKQLLEKFAIYYITAHEYAHILGGDCDSVGTVQNSLQEEAANQAAKELMESALFLRHRMKNGIRMQEQVHALLSALRADRTLFAYACNWCTKTMQNPPENHI